MFRDLSIEIKGFKYQIMIKVLLRKQKENGDIEYATVYFSSTAKTVITFKYDLDKSLQEVLYRIENWINKGSAWKIEYIDGEYINIPIYDPLSGSYHIELPHKLRHPMKGLINIKNNDDKCFLWCHIKHLNPLNKNNERIIKADKKRLMILIMKVLIFLFLKKIIGRLNKKIIFALMYFVMKMI